MCNRRIRIFHCLVALLFGMFAFSCGSGSSSKSFADTLSTNQPVIKRDDQLVLAILYQQRAAEYRALCFQCYNLAKQRVQEAILDPKTYLSNKPLAVVTDLDETALDNSGNEAWLYKNDSAYTDAQNLDWSLYGKPGIVPGSVEFFKFVDSLKDLKKRKILIYYVSNRKDTARESTKRRMQDLKFPQMIDSQFLFRTGPSSKEPRRQHISQADTIILLLGDNLADLNGMFDNTTADSTIRRTRVDNLQTAWGKRYIVFPNSEYGDWEAALYPGGKNTNLSDEQKARYQDLQDTHYTKP